jgi:hypothetical protein
MSIDTTVWRPPRGAVGRPMIYAAMAGCVALAIVAAVQTTGSDSTGDLGALTSNSSLDTSALSDRNTVADTVRPSPDLLPVDTAMETPPVPRPSIRPRRPRAAERPERTGLPSRTAEAAAAGYSPEIEWGEAARPAGDSVVFPFEAIPGLTYLVLARTLEDCDVDLVVSENIEDRTADSDAAVRFNVSEAGQIGVSVLTNSDTRETCPVGLGVYKR